LFGKIGQIFKILGETRRNEGSSYIINLIATNLSQVVSFATLFFLLPVLSNHLSSSDFIEFTLVQTFLSAVSLFDMGLGLGLLSEFAKKEKDSGNIIGSSLQGLFLFLLLCFIFLYLFLLYWIEAPKSLISIYLLGFVVLVLNVFISIFESYIHSNEKYFITKISRIIKNLLEFGAIMYFLENLAVASIILILLIGSTLYLSFLYLLVFKIFRITISFNIYDFLKYCKNSLWIYLMAFSGFLVLQIQLFVLKLQLDLKTFTLYIFIYKFFEVFRTFISSFNVILIPRVAGKYQALKFSEIRNLYFRSITRMIVVLVLAFFILNTFGISFFSWWSQYRKEQFLPLFVIYMIYSFFLLLDNVTVHFLTAIGSAKFPTLVSLLQGFLVLICSYNIPYKFGINGVIVASLLLLLLTSLSYNSYYLLNRRLSAV
jgi:O-antigen/teichoic acid export membrane protein